MTNSEIMRSARESLSGKWALAIGTVLLYMIIVGASSYIIPFVGSLITFVVAGPLVLGLCGFTLNIVRGKEAKLENLFEGFNNFGNAFIAYLLMVVFILLWTLLLIIPGIIAACAYAQTFFIMQDDPEISPTDALSASKKMMDGHKMRYFLLSLLFGLMIIASAILLFIPMFWIMPWMYVTYAKFYEDIKANADTGVADLEAATA